MTAIYPLGDPPPRLAINCAVQGKKRPGGIDLLGLKHPWGIDPLGLKHPGGIGPLDLKHPGGIDPLGHHYLRFCGKKDFRL